MTLQGIFVLVLILGMIAVLVSDKVRPGSVLFSVAVIMMAANIVTPKEALAGFSNRGMFTVGLLFLVSEGISRSGGLDRIARFMLPSRRIPLTPTLGRMLPAVAAMSAFLNNTPIVVLFAPMLKRWAEQMGVSPQKLLIPLSYATILGGICTLIGTTTNLVVDGLMISEGYEGLSMFELGQVGVPIAVVGLLYIVFFSRYLLPGRGEEEVADAEDVKEYYYDLSVPEGSQLIGTPVVNGAMEGLNGMEISLLVREGQVHHTRNVTLHLREGDKLVISGKYDSLHRLMHFRGLELSCLSNCDEKFRQQATTQVEAVLSPRFPGIGEKYAEFDFLRHYGGMVISLHRNGERIIGNYDKLHIREGDNLILLTDKSFMQTWRESTVFYLLSEVGEVPRRHSPKKKLLAVLLMVLMVAGAALGQHISLPWGLKPDMFSMAAITAVVMGWTGMFPLQRYTKYVSWDILITIASAFAISKGMLNSGMADFVAEHTVGMASAYGPYAVLAVIFLITSLFTEVITNNAAAALSFPIALAAAKQLQVDPTPFFITICMGASASFLTPIGYQTNLIVQSVGNYKFKDYPKVGAPLSLIVFILSVMIIPIFWEF